MEFETKDLLRSAQRWAKKKLGNRYGENPIYQGLVRAINDEAPKMSGAQIAAKIIAAASISGGSLDETIKEVSYLFFSYALSHTNMTSEKFTEKLEKIGGIPYVGKVIPKSVRNNMVSAYSALRTSGEVVENAGESK